MNFKKILIIILVIITIASIFGFHDMKKPEHSAYVLAIGIDKAENDKILLTLSCLPPNILNKDTGVQDEEDRLYNTSIVASSLEEGVALAHNYMSTNLNFGHVRAVIFSEEIARGGISKYLISLTDNKMNDTNMNIYISKCNANKFIENISPKLETNPVLYYDIIEHAYKMSAATAPIKLIDFLRDLYDDVKTPMATYCDIVNEDSNKEKSYVEDSENKNSLNPSYLPGNLPEKSKAKTQMLGLAVFKEDKMVGSLNNIETSNHLLIKNDVEFMYRSINAPISKINLDKAKEDTKNKLRDKENPENRIQKQNLTSIQITQTRKPDIKVNIDNDVPIININIPLNYVVVNTNTYSFNYLDKKYMKKLEDTLKTNLEESMYEYLQLTQKEIGLDIDSFAKYLKEKFLTSQKYESYNWSEKYKDAKINVNFDLECRTPGLYKQR